MQLLSNTFLFALQTANSQMCKIKQIILLVPFLLRSTNNEYRSILTRQSSTTFSKTHCYVQTSAQQITGSIYKQI